MSEKNEIEEEQFRWQAAIRAHVIIHSGAPDSRIDGGGCDSSDPLDVSLAEIGQGIGFVEESSVKIGIRRTSPLRVLSLDPSANDTGWAVMEPGKLFASGTWHPLKSAGCDDRFDQLAKFIRGLSIIWLATDAVIETPSGGQRHSATQLMVYARAVGVCEAAAFMAGMRVHRVAVNEWKHNARKSATAQAAVYRFGIKAEGRTHNELDAIALGDVWINVLRHHAGRVGA